MLAAWAALAAAVFVVAGCYASGTLAIAWSGVKLDRYEHPPLAFLLGAGCLHLAIFAAMAMGIATKAAWWILIGGPILLWIVKRPRQPERANPDWKLRIVFGVLTIPFTLLYLANAWAPETSADGSGYHLSIVARYLRAQGFELIPTNMYADLSQGVELIYAPAFAFGKHSAAALVHFAFMIALAWLIYAFGRRIGRPWAGAAAAVMVYASPVVGRDGTTAYIDVATAAIAFAAFYWLEIWDHQRDTYLLMVIGLMAGYAFAAKYTMFVVLPFALAFIAWRERKLRPLLIVSASAMVMIAPWLVKNWMLVQDPVAPFATRIFPSPYFHTAEIDDWAAWLRRYDIANLWTLPKEVTVRGQFAQGIIGAIFLLAPIGLLALRDRIGRRLLAMGAVLLAMYFQNIGTRFLIPCLPYFALAMAMAIDRWRIAVVGFAAIQAIASWYTVIPRYAYPYVWRLDRFPHRAALRILPEKDYLGSRIREYNFLQAMERITSPRDRIFSLAGLSGLSYTSRDVFGPYEGAENNTLFDFLNVARMEGWDPRRILTSHFAPQQTRRIRIVQTTRATGPDQWQVHELRFYSAGVEIPRSQEWRLTSRPNPWEIQLAFDNSNVTRWRSWQPAEPGMYIEVTFPQAQRIDEVRMWTSSEFAWKMAFEVQVQDGGSWRKVTDAFEESQVNPGFLGRAATYELFIRGIHYIVMHDSDRSSDDFTDNPEAWGVVPVLRLDELTLYRILPP